MVWYPLGTGSNFDTSDETALLRCIFRLVCSLSKLIHFLFKSHLKFFAGSIAQVASDILAAPPRWYSKSARGGSTIRRALSKSPALHVELIDQRGAVG